MSFLHLVFCCLTFYIVSEGRMVPVILGQNVSFSWTFNIKRNDAIYILHNGSPIHRFFPNNNSSVPRKPPHRGSFIVDYTTPENITVTIHFLNITANDAGTYRVVRQWNLEDLANSVDLQTTEINHYTTTVTIWKEDAEGITHYSTMATTQKENAEEINYFTATAMSQKEDTKGIRHYATTVLSQTVYTEGINHDTTAAITPELDAEDFPSKRQLLYIVLGMGGILAVTFIAFLLHKIRICLREDRVSNCNTFTDSSKDDADANLQEENLPGNYWTIVSNERGELSTAIEMDFDRRSEPQLIEQTLVPTDNNSEDILRPDNITMNEESDGYLNPVHSSSVEFSEYIHPVHSDPVTTLSNERGKLSTAIEMDFNRRSEPQLIEQTMVPTDNNSEDILRPDNITMNDESDGYLNPVHSSPVEFNEYIHPVHSDPVNTKYIHPVHSDPVNTDFVPNYQ